MEDKLQFCDKTININASEINYTESSLRYNTVQEKFKVIKSGLKTKKETAKKILQHQKLKNLKYKPRTTIQTMTQ